MSDQPDMSHILVTGASSGMGRALALALAQRGNRVIITGRSRERLQEVAAQMPDRLIPLVWDIADSAQAAMAHRFVEEQFGWLDIAILNAGDCEYLDDGVIDMALVRRVFDVNLFGTLEAANTLLPLLLSPLRASAAERPYLVCVSSMSTWLALPRAEAYGASKAALRYFFESLRIDLAGRIDISIVSPGFVSTPLTERNDFPMPFLIDADAAAQRILDGMWSRRLHIAFPRRLGWSLKFVALLPERLRLRVMSRLARH
jgi:NAD(P)-dependent dehydrogenase (short-subunit alcohol dehydrogenase family)